MINFISSKGESITFFHIPKNGGTSVRQGIFGHKGYKEGWGKYNSYSYNDEKGGFADHFTYAEAKRRGYIIHNRSLAFVRNPWARCVSAYLYLRAEPLFIWSIPKDMSFSKWVKERWIADECDEWRPCGWHQQYEYLIDAKGNIAVTDIHRIEDVDIFSIFEKFLATKLDKKIYNSSAYILQPELSESLKAINNKPAINHKDYNDYRTFYDSKLVDEVAKIYHKDIELFNYTF